MWSWSISSCRTTSWLPPSKKLTLNAMSRLPRCPAFTIIRKDRKRNNGGGLAFLVRDTLQFRVFDVPPSPNPTQEQQAIAVKSGDGELKIINVYIPPVSSSPTAFIPSLSHLNHLLECLILGDFNAHHPQWHSEHGDEARGRHLADIIDHSVFAVLNENTATRVSSNGCRTSPDISLASSDIFGCAAWRTITALNSDHLPIIITLQCEFSKVSSARRTFINFSKADWDGFYTACEKGFSNAATPTDAFTEEQQFRQILIRAGKYEMFIYR